LLTQPELHPFLLFCDDGDKPREFRTCVPWLWPGDLVAVYDWDMEFGVNDVQPVAVLVTELLASELYAYPKSKTRFFRRVGEAAT